MRIPYEQYLDKVLGGFIGKSMGGAIGARFEGCKEWIEISPDEMFPDKMPPNDDLDLQVLWLKVLEEKGAALTSDDLAAAWLEGCWYPFNEYGMFRRNWRLGLHPPMSGRFGNRFWETGMGCPIRAEVWGYVFPGAPDLAAAYAEMDGTLDHTEQSVGAEKMFAAMAAMAFFVPDVKRLASMFIHYLPEGTPVERLTRAAFEAYDEGLSLRDARDRLMALAGVPEACDAQINVPFTFLGLLYGEGDLQETMLSALRCGYDTDCTLATSAALIGQILGAARIPEALKAPVGDELVMGIEYRRPEMTLSALARDTARVGVLLAKECGTAVEIEDAPKMAPLPATAKAPAVSLSVEYQGLPAAAPGDIVSVRVRVHGGIGKGGRLEIEPPQGWLVVPPSVEVDAFTQAVDFDLHAPSDIGEWPMRNIFTARLEGDPPAEHQFGVAGAALWRLLGVYFDTAAPEDIPNRGQRRMNHHFVRLDREYLNEPDLDARTLFDEFSKKLGRPAVLPSYENDIYLPRLVGLQGEYCAYLARTVISPEEREAYLVVGNNDSYRLYLNGGLAVEADEYTCWSPFNNVHKVKLRKGSNELLLKLLKRGDALRFTLGFRAAVGRRGANCEDWLVDLADAVP